MKLSCVMPNLPAYVRAVALEDSAAKSANVSAGVAYGFDFGDFVEDDQLDIAVARSGGTNMLYLAAPASPATE